MNEEDLIPGHFYWVIPVLDPDADEEWESELQPARFIGSDGQGGWLWHCLNIEGASNWPMRFIGDEIKAQEKW